jgi:hypothetical protein
MKFNEQYTKFAALYVESGNNPNSLPVLQGDQVVFRKGWEKEPYMANIANTSTGERIRAMMEQQDNALIATCISAVHAGSSGSYVTADNASQDEKQFRVTVSQQYALGLYKNVVDVPMACLQRVDHGINLPPLSKSQNQEYRQTLGEAPKMNAGTEDPTKQTHAASKDKGIHKL